MVGHRETPDQELVDSGLYRFQDAATLKFYPEYSDVYLHDPIVIIPVIMTGDSSLGLNP